MWAVRPSETLILAKRGAQKLDNAGHQIIGNFGFRLGGVPQSCIMWAIRPSETLILVRRVAPKLHNVGRQTIGNFAFSWEACPKVA